MIEEAEYVVRFTLTTTIQFSPIERERPITRQDAIVNALGTMPDDVWKGLEDEGWSIESVAEHVSSTTFATLERAQEYRSHRSPLEDRRRKP